MRSFNYTGEDAEVPHDATHITVDKSVRVIRQWEFSDDPNIEDVACDLNVKRVEDGAFFMCPSLRLVIMPGVEDVERSAFICCKALTGVECGKLERIGDGAFKYCESLMSINLPSTKIVERYAFAATALTDAKFGASWKVLKI